MKERIDMDNNIVDTVFEQLKNALETSEKLLKTSNNKEIIEFIQNSLSSNAFQNDDINDILNNIETKQDLQIFISKIKEVLNDSSQRLEELDVHDSSKSDDDIEFSSLS